MMVLLLGWHWEYFLVYCGESICAYATCYEEYQSTPQGQVMISQVLVLPPYQGTGIGYCLLQSLYAHYLRQPKCALITVEDPAPAFQRLKDTLDA